MQRTSHKPELGLLFILLFVIAAFVIWVRTSTVRETYSYVQAEKNLKKEQQDLQNLRLKWGRMTQSKRLETIAGKTGLVPPTMDQVMKYSSRSLATSAH